MPLTIAPIGKELTVRKIAVDEKLKKHLELEFELKKNQQIYWDDIALFCHPEDYHLGIQEMNRKDVIEIDSIYELAQLDNYYKKYIHGGL